MLAPSSRSQSLLLRLDRAERTIETVRTDPELSPLMASFGYDTAALEQGRLLCERAREMQRVQERSYGAKYTATAAAAEARARAKASYKLLTEVARVTLRGERGAIDTLGLGPGTKTSLVAWIDHARRFYSNALSRPELLHRLTRFNITREQVEAGQRDVEQFDQARRAQERERVQAREATTARNAAVRDLDAWVDDFLGIAQAVTEGRPELRAKLGLRGRA
jgi:hypothetical protein